jgi:hypothetical protein
VPGACIIRFAAAQARHMNVEWAIKSRNDHCAVTGRPFTDGEFFYTLLFDEPAGFRREDLSAAAWKERPPDAPQPFSLWRSKYEVPATAPEPLGKATAEDLLRRYMAEKNAEFANARYILAVMLERKRLLKEIETRRGDEGALLRIYEHVKTGEVFVIPDPQLRLDQIADVQAQIAELLTPPVM